jgi:biopolymer transport protein ExbD
MSRDSFAGGDDMFTGRRQKHEEVLIDFTPMIDCMFLLLMFNMVAYTITGGSDIEVPSARYAKGADAPQATAVTILAPKQPGADATYHLTGAGSPNVTLDEIKKAAQDAAAAGTKQVVIKAEKKVPYKYVQEVAQVIGSIDGGSLLIAVQQPK